MPKHRPPAVLWDLGPSRWKRHALKALIVLSGSVWVGFLLLQGWGWSSALLLSCLLVSTWVAAISGSRFTEGQLSWDGEQWHWLNQGDQLLQSLVCVLDLQVMLLLRSVSDDGKSHWFWLDSGVERAPWKALRRAIVASTFNTRDTANRCSNGDTHDN